MIINQMNSGNIFSDSEVLDNDLSYGNIGYTNSGKIVGKAPITTGIAELGKIKNITCQLGNVTYGNGKFIISETGSNYSYHSTDGFTWEQSRLVGSSQKYAVSCYGGGIYITLGGVIPYGFNGSSSDFSYSEDGITWKNLTLPASGSWVSVSYGSSGFLVTSKDATSTYLTSSNGIDWILRTLPVAGTYYANCYGDGKYVLISKESNSVLYSSDGINWDVAYMPISSSWRALCYGNNKYVAVSYGASQIAYSYDAINWTLISLPIKSSWISICSNNDVFTAVSFNSNAIITSKDGMEWTLCNAIASAQWGSVCWGHDKFVAITSDHAAQTAELRGLVSYSYDGYNWTNNILKKYIKFIDTPGTELNLKLYCRDNIYSGIITSIPVRKFSNWITTSPALMGYDVGSWQSLCFDGNRFLCCSKNYIVYSENGINWTQLCKLPYTDRNYTKASLVYNNGKYVLILSGGSYNTTYAPIVLVSNNCVDWTNTYDFEVGSKLYNLHAVGDKYLAVEGTSNVYYLSDDGINWTKNVLTGIYNIDEKSIAYGKRKIIIIGKSSSGNNFVACQSSDGINWDVTTVDTYTNMPFRSILFDGDRFVASVLTGTTIKFASSVDGVNWSIESTMSCLSNSQADYLCYGDGFYMFKYAYWYQSGSTYRPMFYAYTSRDLKNWVSGGSVPYVNDNTTNGYWNLLIHAKHKFVLANTSSNMFGYILTKKYTIE